jgi:hypothetical protein
MSVIAAGQELAGQFTARRTIGRKTRIAAAAAALVAVAVTVGVWWRADRDGRAVRRRRPRG